ncbi:MAG: cytochrome c3 family protein [Myxococcales bacterium]|nr:cytochrome c3 family protein [Myxococcales bacterium]
MVVRAIAASTVLFSTAALAQGITSTKHNFQSQTNPVHVDPSATEDGICVFCHTPHKGASSLLLWNHTFSANNYSWADVSGGKTTGGTSYPTNVRTWTGSTAKCLSCHDGTVSIGAIYWSNATASPTVTMAGTDVGASGNLNNASYIIPDQSTGTDLKGNHPVGVPYSYDQAVATYNGISTGPDVKLAQWVARPTGVRVFGSGGGGAPAAGAAGIECASCHDPHGTGNTFFLRVTKSGSQLCLSCHIK